MLATIRPDGWNVTALPRVAQSSPLGRDAVRIDPSFRLVAHPGYDGQFYWAIAVDPLATGSVHRDVDKPSYRYGHPLLGWLGWLFSAGRGSAAAGALLALGLLAIAAAAALAATLGGFRASLFVTCNPGLLYSAAHSLVEPLAVALILAAVVAFERRPRLALALCVLLPLAKEQLVLVPLVLAASRRSPRLALAVLPAVAWWIAMRIHFGAWFTTGADTALATPLAGWRRAVLDAGVHAAGSVDAQTLLILAALGALLLVATIASLRANTPLRILFLPFAVLVACLRPNATVILRDALRNTAILVALVPFVVRTRGRGA